MDLERKRRLDEIGFEFDVKDEANEEEWNLQFKQLLDHYEKHGHCELFWAVDRFTIIFNTPTNTPPASLPELQAMCHLVTREFHHCHWAVGSICNVHA
jgi:hypothetical protein